jgi:hypothetical protein
MNLKQLQEKWSKYLDQVDVEVPYDMLDTFEFEPGTHIISNFSGLPLEIKRSEKWGNVFTIIAYNNAPNGSSCALQHMLKTTIFELCFNAI